MGGVASDPVLMGVIPRAFRQIFDHIATNNVPGKKFLVRASYIEIYNEEVRDLIAYHPTNRLELKEHPDKGVYIAGVLKTTVSSVEQISKLMDQGMSNRSVGSTLMNADSSRSHSIFTVEVETSEPNEAGDETIKQGVLNLVDLAGSERQGKTGATGQRLKEGAKINLSLSALGNVISSLVAGKTHIPYRDSKLTRLLQNSLGGNAKTLMIAAISPAHYNYEETLSTLRYANRAKNIKNKPKVNEDPRDTLLREYQDEIKRLKELLTKGDGAGGAGGAGGGGGAVGGIVQGSPEWEQAMEVEKQRMIAEAKEEMRRLEREKQESLEEAMRMRELLEQERNEQAERIRMLEEAAAAAMEAKQRRRETLIAGKASAARAKRAGAGATGAGSATSTSSSSSPSSTPEGQGGESTDAQGANQDADDEHDDGFDEEEAALDQQASAIESALAEERERARGLDESIAAKLKNQESLSEHAVLDAEERARRQTELQEKLDRLQSSESARAELEERLKEMQRQLLEGGQEALDAKRIAEQHEAELRRVQREAERQQRQQEEMRTMMEGDIYSAKGELADKDAKIRNLQKTLRQKVQDMEDLQREFETERETYASTIRALTREGLLYQAMAKAAYKPGDIELILRSATFDENKSNWILPRITVPVVLPVVSVGATDRTGSTMHPPSQIPVFGAPGRARASQGSQLGGEVGRIRADTSLTNPQPLSARADGDWKRSIRAAAAGGDVTQGGYGASGGGYYSQNGHPVTSSYSSYSQGSHSHGYGNPAPPSEPKSARGGRPHTYNRPTHSGGSVGTSLGLSSTAPGVGYGNHGAHGGHGHDDLATPATHLSQSASFASEFPFASGSRISPAESRSRAGTVGDRMPSRGGMDVSTIDSLQRRAAFDPASPVSVPPGSAGSMGGGGSGGHVRNSSGQTEDALSALDSVRKRAVFDPAAVSITTSSGGAGAGDRASSPNVNLNGGSSSGGASPSLSSLHMLPPRSAFVPAAPLGPPPSSGYVRPTPPPAGPNQTSSPIISLDSKPRRAGFVPSGSSTPGGSFQDGGSGGSIGGGHSATSSSLDALDGVQRRASFTPA